MPRTEPTSFQEALEAFEALEQELELSEWTINGVYVWKLIRFFMFRQFQESLGLVQTAHPEAARLKRETFQIVTEFPRRFATRNPFTSRKNNTDRVVIPHSRKGLKNGQVIDPISLRAYDKRYKETSAILDKSSLLDRQVIQGSFDYEVLQGVGWLKGQLSAVRFGKDDLRRMKEIRRILKNDIDIERLVRKEIKYFDGVRSATNWFLKKTRPKALYTVVGYSKHAPISAAHDLGIETVEFQHGSIGRGHLGYDFKSWPFVPYFSNRLLTFGPNWCKDIHFPGKSYIDPIGYPALEDAIAHAAECIERDSKQLLVLSQGPVNNEVLRHAATFGARRPDWKVVIRPHPSENAEELTDNMNRLGVSDNWRIEKDRSLQEHAVVCGAVLGVNSTALVEALLAGCRVALLDISSSAGYFDDLAREGHATKVRDGDELADAIDDLPEGTARGYFSDPIQDIVGRVEGEG